jgi:7-cyano-7-deazaguanine synthase
VASVVVCSGGMDSTVLAYKVKQEDPEDLTLVSFDYGQRHRRELSSAEAVADRLEAEWVLIDLVDYGAVLESSALTNREVPVPHGHYADESMRATVVPNRNAVMLSMAFGLAVDRGAKAVYTGVHAGDHPVYPDCRPEFVVALNRALRLATEGYRHPDLQLLAPFVGVDKTEVARLGVELGVPFNLTWSCYEGGPVHCGRCGTCVERREALTLAGAQDPTVYAR